MDLNSEFANNFNYTVRRTQPIKTNLCGHYFLYYAFKKCEGYFMEDIINNFPTKDDLVDVVNKIFYICEFSQCSLLQCCSRC